jgi:glycosyltransferase involved in cell wall biosynthesis
MTAELSTGHNEGPVRYEEAISVILPAFNEGEIIEEMVETTYQYLSAHFAEFEIIVVDDGSTDDTNQIVSHLAQQRESIALETHPTNRGKATAFRTGVDVSNYALLLSLDADLELDPSRLDRFLSIREETDADIVVGSKTHPDSDIEYPVFRTILSRGYAWMIRILFSLDVDDPQTGMKLFSRESLQDCLPELKATGLAFSVELLIIAQLHGYHIEEAPISLDYSGNTHVSIGTVLDMFAHTVRLFVAHHIWRKIRF